MLRVDVTKLVGRPGATRRVDQTFLRSDLDVPEGHWGPADEALASPISLDLVLEMLVDKLVARGTVSFTTVLACARCLRDVSAAHAVDVIEVYTDPHGVLDEDEEVEAGYELHRAEAVIDLEALVRDAILSTLPLRTLCSDDCQGLCPVCGIDRNRGDCGHGREQRRDPRWAPLEKLDLSEPREEAG